jgi:hypothetical protein
MGSTEPQATQSKETFLSQTMTDSFPFAQVITNAPKELREKPQWVLWRGVDRRNQRTGDVKVNKVPIDPRTLKNADKTDPRTWGTFEDCCEGIKCALKEWEAADPDAYRGGGLGFVFTENDPYAGIDLDDCRHPETGALEPWAQQLIAVLDSYTEISPSGTGVHLYVKGRLAGTGQNKQPLELYDRKAYFTVTGAHLPGTPATIEDRQDVIEWLYVAMPILAKLLADSGRREKFSQLFAGDISGYGSQSEADLALCSLAGKVNASAEQIDALMRLSGLYREKWGEMHGAQTYGQMTMAKAREGQEHQSGSSRTLAPEDVVCLDAVQSEQVSWLWKPYLPLGKLVSLEGDLGTGKSTLAAMLAAHVTTARPFPGEEGTEREPRTVLYLQSEDGLADTLRPRLEAAGAELRRVQVLSHEGMTVDDPRLEQAIAKYRPALVIIDPLQDYMKPRTNINQENEVRAVLKGLRSHAETYHCTLLCVRHFGKDPEKKAIHRAIGSVAFSAVMRSILQVQPGQEPHLFTLKHTKTNIGPFGRPLAYSIVSATVPLPKGGLTETSRIEWAEHAPSTEGEDRGSRLGPEAKKQKEAEDFLRSQLANGPRAASELLEAAREQGITGITLNRAKVALRVKSTEGGGRNSCWVLPQHGPVAADIWEITTNVEELLAQYPGGLDEPTEEELEGWEPCSVED